MRQVYEKLFTIRMYKRAGQVGDVDMAVAKKMMSETGLTAEQCEEIFRLTSLPTFDERFVIPPMHREYATELMSDDGLMGSAYEYQAKTGIGFKDKPKRGL